jgi:Fur family ferric uptake transcriptional regulator
MNELLHKSAGNIDRVTTYRTIDVFEKIGLVHRIYIGWKYKLELSDQFLRHHHHISCLSCGTVIDIEDEQHIDEFIRKIADEFGFAPRSHNFEIDGYCANCQKSSHKS